MKDIGQAKLRYMLPKEGFMLWMDGIAIPTTAPSPYAAHLFLNFILEPVNAGAAATYIGYQPAVEAAMQYITDPVQKAMRPTPEHPRQGPAAQGPGRLRADVSGRLGEGEERLRPRSASRVRA